MSGVSVNGVPAHDAYPSPAYSWYVVAVFFVAYIFSYVDRTILTLLVGPIRASLNISDVEISLLHGFAFAVFYTVLGIPIARLADSRNRTVIISVGVFVWSIMSALCGLANSFLHMFLARVGVGVGEAALGPASNSIMADMFPPEKVAKPLSVYYSAMYLGSGLALIAGGAIIAVMPPIDLPVIGHLEPWQGLFVVVGLPGVLLVAFTATIREPVRKGVLKQQAVGAEMPMRDVIKYIRDRLSTYGNFIVGLTVSSMVWNGAAAWIPTYFIRTFGWTPTEVGLRYGFGLMIAGLAGAFAGGWLSAWLKQRGRVDADVRVALTSALIMWPTGVIAPLMPTGELALAVYCMFVFGGSLPWGAASAALQAISPNQMRALIIAILFFGLNLAGIGLGPTVVAAITDGIFQNDAAVKYSLAIVSAVVLPISAAILWAALPHYRRTYAERSF